MAAHQDTLPGVVSTVGLTHGVGAAGGTVEYNSAHGRHHHS